MISILCLQYWKCRLCFPGYLWAGMWGRSQARIKCCQSQLRVPPFPWISTPWLLQASSSFPGLQKLILTIFARFAFVFMETQNICILFHFHWHLSSLHTLLLFLHMKTVLQCISIEKVEGRLSLSFSIVDETLKKIRKFCCGHKECRIYNFIQVLLRRGFLLEQALKELHLFDHSWHGSCNQLDLVRSFHLSLILLPMLGWSWLREDTWKSEVWAGRSVQSWSQILLQGSKIKPKCSLTTDRDKLSEEVRWTGR